MLWRAVQPAFFRFRRAYFLEVDMNRWRTQFIVLSQQLPECPQTPELDKYRKAIFEQLRGLWGEGNLLESDEPKVVVKIPATDFQKSKFNENYTFAFQSLLTGRKSQFIPYCSRLKYHIFDTDKKNGGVFPDLFNFANNPKLVNDYYYALLRRLYKKQSELMQNYYKQIDALKNEWKEVYYNYLQSNEWKTIREIRLELDYYRCVICESTTNLQIHHLTYDNVGDEDIRNDLITLCMLCHQNAHGRTHEH